MKIEIHLLQNFAPSCLNRDDTNTPKFATFGGVTRARVSSQSWKRAARSYFPQVSDVPVGLRSKQVSQEIVAGLVASGKPEADAERAVVAALGGLKIKVTEGKSEYLVPISRHGIARFVEIIGEDAHWEALLVAKVEPEGAEKKTAKDAKKEAKAAVPAELIKKLTEALDDRRAADLGLFGRMLADLPDRRIDGACQVAHALSTHAVDIETDFYTAVDDLTEERGEIGAGMMGTQGFNSACFYRYALIDTEQLKTNLGGDAELVKQTVEAFLRAFTLAIPSAKQNSHAAQNLPSYGLFVVRSKGVPVSLANAFAKPVKSADLIGASIKELRHYREQMDKVYGLYGEATLAEFQATGEAQGSLEEAVTKILGEL
jgi:CRISPR system Cascade subunit CasC